MTNALEIRGLLKTYPRFQLGPLDLTVPRGAIYGLIGPNGAGKTTLFNVLTGLYRCDGGKVLFDGLDLIGLKPHRIVEAGMARTFQNIRLFNDLRVLDNVLTGFHVKSRASFLEAVMRLPRYRREEGRHRIQAINLLEELGLEEAAGEKAGQLPYGHQRRLEIARALATRPSLLLLDEPAAGLNPQETLELIQFLKDIRERYGLTLLIIEHNLRLVMNLCEHLTVLDHGLTIAQGPPAVFRG